MIMVWDAVHGPRWDHAGKDAPQRFATVPAAPCKGLDRRCEVRGYYGGAPCPAPDPPTADIRGRTAAFRRRYVSAGLPRDQGTYRGLYEWDSASLAEAYARALWRVLALVSVRESIRYHVIPGVHRDALLQNPAMVSAEGREDWWRLTAAQLPRSPMNRVH